MLAALFMMSLQIKGQHMALTTKQWQLYNLIKENSLKGVKTTQLEICQKIDGYEWKYRKGTTDKCSAIWNDVRDLNLSSETEKIIITHRYTYWIGNEQETEDYLKACWRQIAPALNRYWSIVRKIKSNGQYKLLSTKGDIIDAESKARAYVESFIEVDLQDKTLEQMSLEELRDVYKALCEELNQTPIKYYSEDIYIQEIKWLQDLKKKRSK